MKFKAIIFDFDGVIFDSEKIHLQACNEVFQSLGFKISEEEYFQSYVGLSDNEMFNRVLQDKNIFYNETQTKRLRRDKIDAYKAIINEHNSLFGLFNIENFLNSNESQFQSFAICSGATREEIDATLSKIQQGELKKFFKTIVTIDDVNAGKPAPEGYLLTAARLGLPPKQCLAIEDTPKGARAAKAAGMSVVVLDSSAINKLNFPAVDLIASSYDEIDTWLKQNNN